MFTVRGPEGKWRNMRKKKIIGTRIGISNTKTRRRIHFERTDFPLCTN